LRVAAAALAFDHAGMTIEELLAREGVRHTLASYNMAGDRGRTEDFLAVFTEDAVFEADSFRQEGKAAIRQWFTGFKADEPAAKPRPRAKFVRHNLTTCLIEVTGPDSATARTYYTVLTDIGPDHCGYYVDVFRKVGERWLIAHRKARMDWKSPASVFVPAPD
jgi:hypothetical protein